MKTRKAQNPRQLMTAKSEFPKEFKERKRSIGSPSDADVHCGAIDSDDSAEFAVRTTGKSRIAKGIVRDAAVQDLLAGQPHCISRLERADLKQAYDTLRRIARRRDEFFAALNRPRLSERTRNGTRQVYKRGRSGRGLHMRARMRPGRSRCRRSRWSE